MSHYIHLTIAEREKIIVLHTSGRSYRNIAETLGRNVSTISREVKRNSNNKEYSAVAAQEQYRRRRKKCVRQKVLENEVIRTKVQTLFFEKQWSPEQISKRLFQENHIYQISYNTIYRAIYVGMFNTKELKSLYGFNKASRKLRHRGKRRKKREAEETRGTFKITNSIHDRPQEANERSVIGHWEADTVLGKHGKSCLITSVDRHSRFLLSGKISVKQAELLKDRMIPMFCTIPEEYRKSVTPDRGKEFAEYLKITQALNGMQFYFADPNSPWQRGTNENTNGLLREYFPKSCDFDNISDYEISDVVSKINLRPRKCLNWLSPFEVFYGVSLHLI